MFFKGRCTSGSAEITVLSVGWTRQTCEIIFPLSEFVGRQGEIESNLDIQNYFNSVPEKISDSLIEIARSSLGVRRMLLSGK